MSVDSELNTPRSRPRWRLWLGFGLILVAAGSFIASFFVRWNEVLERVQLERGRLVAWAGEQPLLASVIYLLGYAAFAGLALPGAPIITLLGGAVFGVWWGTVLVSLGSTTGATLSFLASRYLLRERFQAKYAERLVRINSELDRGGVFYLLALRLNPVIPFFVINLLFGLTRMPVRRFWWVSQLGMLPATFIYVNAGAQLAEIESVSDIVSLRVLGSLLALSVFPLVARGAAKWLQKEEALAKHAKSAKEE
jgi:uncharacterized membrane protein YdjX (TVP38/TMEM64 family)